MSADERRKEPRTRSRGPMRLAVPGGDQIAGTVYDVSQSGLSAEVCSEIQPGMAVRIEGHGWEGAGVVKHCSRRGAAWLVGVELDADEQ